MFDFPTPRHIIKKSVEAFFRFGNAEYFPKHQATFKELQHKENPTCHHFNQDSSKVLLLSKGVIVYTAACDWFRGKNSKTYKGILAIYRTVFYVLLLDLYIAGFLKMAAEWINTNFSSRTNSGKDIALFAKNNGLYVQHAGSVLTFSHQGSIFSS